MKKYRVLYAETKWEAYEIEATSREDAEERFLDDGNLTASGTEDGNIQSIKEIPA